ncbi:Positive regulator of purine utilization [Pseudocercospora fuligena]|uniref:Positive regulator of purine utilization n=1 Tax=Pseudocercospora fuligena TaxID=685502 RepID=A0A8H6VCQ0_9PEZI|nr:Positive regulator of purine utilization [Pseudocercospora fuligena]
MVAGGADGNERAPDRGKTAKKVRLACQRCRDRRIKCDGLTPSCSKCTKAGVPCIDVDARHGNNLPRAFLADAQARLEWLEDVVRTRAPDVDLSAGPKRPDTAVSAGAEPRAASSASPTIVDPQPMDNALAQPSGTKRARSDDELSALSRKARRMALDLGLFSLNTNVSQTHYLGSSSGTFFANLLPREEAGSGTVSEPDSDNEEPPLEVRQRTEGSHALFQTLCDMLPPRTDCDRMNKLFYNYYHGDYPVLHQPSFQVMVDALYACTKAASACSLQHNGWPSSIPVFEYNGTKVAVNGKDAIAIPVRTAAAQLFFVLSIAADLQTRKRVFIADPSKFHAQALALFQISLAEISVASIQAMVLFVLQNFLTPEGGSIWVILHIAQAYAIDLGLHKTTPSSSRLSQTAVHMRRRTFFSLYVLDSRFVSTAQGRPIGFQDDTLDLTMPTINIIANNSDKYNRDDQALLPYSITHFKWARLISDIKYHLYRFTAQSSAPTHASDVQMGIRARLDTWSQESAAAMDAMPESVRKRFLTIIHIDYHFALGLLYQPSHLCPKPDEIALRQCFDSATQRIQLYWSLYNQNNLSLSWPRTHGIFFAGAVMIYCIWTSPELRTSISTAGLAADLRLCSSLLTLGGEWWPLVQRGRRSFEKLADSTIKILLNRHPNKAGPAALIPGHSGLDGPTDFSMDPTQFLDVESMLQSFLQHDYDLPEMLDIIDASPFETYDASWDNTVVFGNQVG